jgi:hypothetical protein
MARASTQATNLAGTDASTAAQQGAEAQGINNTLNPFLQNELRSPQGYSQGAMTAMLGSSMAGTGGATSGVTGQAALEQARTRNASGFSGALDAAQRMRGQQNASASEGVAANNAQLQQQQQQSAASGLSGMYGTDSSNALNALGLQDKAIQTASDTGWLNQAVKAGTGAVSAAAQAYKAYTG